VRKLVYKRDETPLGNNPADFNQNQINLRRYIQNGHEKNKKTREAAETLSSSSVDEFEGCYYQPKDDKDRTLVFESRFESGNLSMVSKV
jgi:hypothetical protein